MLKNTRLGRGNSGIGIIFEGELRRSTNWYMVEYDIPRGNIATYFPEANELIPLDSTANGAILQQVNPLL